MNDRITIVGPGKVGLSLAYALLQAEAVDEVTICGRRPDPPSHPLFNQDLARYVFGLEPPGHMESPPQVVCILESRRNPEARISSISSVPTAPGPERSARSRR